MRCVTAITSLMETQEDDGPPVPAYQGKAN